MTISECKGARNISDDILLWGSNLAEIDERTEKVFQKLHKSGLKLNLKKCVFGVQEVGQNSCHSQYERASKCNRIKVIFRHGKLLQQVYKGLLYNFRTNTKTKCTNQCKNHCIL